MGFRYQPSVRRRLWTENSLPNSRSRDFDHKGRKYLGAEFSEIEHLLATLVVTPRSPPRRHLYRHVGLILNGIMALIKECRLRFWVLRVVIWAHESGPWSPKSSKHHHTWLAHLSSFCRSLVPRSWSLPIQVIGPLLNTNTIETAKFPSRQSVPIAWYRRDGASGPMRNILKRTICLSVSVLG